LLKAQRFPFVSLWWGALHKEMGLEAATDPDLMTASAAVVW